MDVECWVLVLGAISAMLTGGKGRIMSFLGPPSRDVVWGLDVSVSRRSRDLIFKRLGLGNFLGGLVSVSSRTENQMSRSRFGIGA
jgi:hypothetical protein